MLRTIRNRFRVGESVNVLGVRVDPINMESAVERVITWARSADQWCRYVCVSGMHGVVEAQSSERFQRALNRADLNVPDGMPLTWIGWFTGFREMGRVFGPDLMMRICQESVRHNVSHFFYGGNEGIAEDLAGRLERSFPGLRTAGTFCPPFRSLSNQEKVEIVGVINSSGAQIVWIGLSTPKQESLMEELHGLLSARVVVGVGAAFDYNTDRLRRAPRWMQKGGLEWFYRIVQEPRRLIRRYAAAIPRFAVGLAFQAFGLRSQSPVK